MTATVVLHCGEFVMIGTDTRTAFGDPPTSFDDDAVKLWRSDAGLITGYGYVPLLDAVKQRFVAHGVEHTDQLATIVHEERTARERWDPGWRSTYALDTGWFVTYETIAEGVRRVRCRCVRADGDSWGASAPFALVQLPHGARPDEARSLEKALLPKVRAVETFVGLYGAIHHHAELAAEVVRYASERFNTCGPWMSVGVHAVCGSRRFTIGATLARRSRAPFRSPATATPDVGRLAVGPAGSLPSDTPPRPHGGVSARPVGHSRLPSPGEASHHQSHTEPKRGQ